MEVRKLKTALLVTHALVSLALILVVTLQSEKGSGLSGAIAGGAQSFFGKKKGAEEKLERLTAILAIGFVITSLVAVLLQ